MSKKVIKKSALTQGIERIDNYAFYILLLVMGIMPLLVRGKAINVISPKIEPFIGSGIKVDFFTYYKMLFLIILTSLALLLFLYKVKEYKYEIKNSYINIPIIILLAWALLSTLLSKYKYTALIGIYNRNEGLLTILCYLILFFIAANIKTNKKSLTKVLWALGLVTIINTIMSVLNFYGYQLIKSPLLNALIIPESLKQSVAGYIMATLNNPNYVAGFGGVITVFFLFVMLISQSRSVKLLSAFLTLSAFAMTLVGLSSGGFITLIATMPLVIVLVVILKGWRALAPIVGIILLCSGVFVILNSHNAQIKSETIDEVNGLIRQQSSRLITPPTALAAPKPSFVPTITEEHFKLPTPSTSMGSNRGYIWENTFKLIKERPVFGYGFDTYIYNFPQHDINKAVGMGRYDIIVDKPHNMFLGMAYNAGIPFALLFIVIIGLYLRDCIKLVRQRNEDNIDREELGWSIAICLFVITFLIQGLVNDSIIATTTIFWVLLGLSVGINRNLIRN